MIKRPQISQMTQIYSMRLSRKAADFTDFSHWQNLCNPSKSEE